MADKIIITSDGTVKGTTVKLNGTDMTKDYKVKSISLYAHGGYTYNSSYSSDSYTTPPAVDYQVSYIDGDKSKSVGVSSKSTNYEYGALAQKDSIIGVGTEDVERLKEKLLDEFDKLRDKDIKLPDRVTLEKRSVESLSDKYTDTVNELELKAKAEKEKK